MTLELRSYLEERQKNFTPKNLLTGSECPIGKKIIPPEKCIHGGCIARQQCDLAGPDSIFPFKEPERGPNADTLAYYPPQ